MAVALMSGKLRTFRTKFNFENTLKFMIVNKGFQLRLSTAVSLGHISTAH